jgi:phenylacetate-CoA ligase
MARPALEALQVQRLGEVLPHAYSHSALHRGLWDRAGIQPGDVDGLEDFVKLVPTFDKDTVRRVGAARGDPFGGLLCVAADQLSVLGSSSGTTGDPTPLPQQARGPLVHGIDRDFWELGARVGDAISYANFTFRAGHAAERFERLRLRPIFIDHEPAEVSALMAASRRFRPTVLYVINNPMILAIEAHFQKSGDDPIEAFSSYRCAVFGGEPMAARSRRRVAEWGLDIREMTALGDVCAAIECRERVGFHAWEDLVLVESVAPDGNDPVADGERGELVVTSLTERAAPVIRYRSGDIIELDRRRCACGRTHARFRVLGRKGDRVVVQGRILLPRDVWSAIESIPATSAGLFQIVRERPDADRLRLRVGFEDTVPPLGLAADVASAVEAAIGLLPVVELVTNEELLKQGPPHKIPRVTSS